MSGDSSSLYVTLVPPDDKNDFDDEFGSVNAVDHSHSKPTGKRTASVLSGVFNLSSTILGASCLSMPHATRDIGVVLYIVLLVIVGLMAEFSLRLLARCTIIANKHTFYAVGHAAMGRTGEFLAIAVVLIQQLGACCAYIKIIGTIVKPIVAGISNPTLSSEAFWQLFLAAVVMFPLCMLRRIDSLKFSSLTAVALVMLFALMLVLDGFYRVHQGLPSDQPVVAVSTSVSDIFNSIPVMCFAFVCQMNFFPVVAELKDPSPKRMGQVTAGAVCVCFVVYVFAGNLGYLAFLDCTEGDIISSYQNIHNTLGVDKLLVPTVLVKVLQLGIGMALVFTYPVLAFELRHSMDELFFGGRPFSWVRHTGENVALVAVSCIVAIEVKDVTTVFSFTGATMSCMVVFVLPSLFYFKLEPKAVSESWMKKFAVLMMAIGIILIPVCLTVLVNKAVHPHGHSASCPGLAPPLPHNSTINGTADMSMGFL